MDIWDVYQHYQINRATLASKDAQRDARHAELRTQSELLRLESKIDGLALVCQALVELLEERGGVSEDEIARRIDAIDLRDGRADGRISGGPTSCPQCERPAHTRQRACMYCGSPIEQGMLLEKLVHGADR